MSMKDRYGIRQDRLLKLRQDALERIEEPWAAINLTGEELLALVEEAEWARQMKLMHR